MDEIHKPRRWKDEKKKVEEIKPADYNRKIVDMPRRYPTLLIFELELPPCQEFSLLGDQTQDMEVTHNLMTKWLEYRFIKLNCLWGVLDNYRILLGFSHYNQLLKDIIDKIGKDEMPRKTSSIHQIDHLWPLDY